MGKKKLSLTARAACVTATILIFVALFFASLFILVPATVSANTDNSLTINGDPLRITVYDDSTFMVYRHQDSEWVYQYYDETSKGSAIFLNGSDVSYCWGGGNETFDPGSYYQRFTPVSHSQPNPWTIITSYKAGDSGVFINEIVTYTNGDTYYKVAYEISNNGTSSYNDLRFFNGCDAWFGGNDYSLGHCDTGLKTVYLTHPGVVAGSMSFYGDAAQSPADHFYEGYYSDVEEAVMSGNHLPDTVLSDEHDSAYSLEWDHASLNPGDTWRIYTYEKWTSPPAVTTNSPTNITKTGATFGGNVTSEGDASVTERGFCWSYGENPTLSNNNIIDSSTGTGSFTCTVTGLLQDTGHHVRAYATNSTGTSYGNDVNFETLGPEWRQGIQKGDILVVRADKTLIGAGLFYTHSGIYVGDGLVAEALDPEGAVLKPITNWDNPKMTYVTRLRLKANYQTKGSQAADWARAQTQRVPKPGYDKGWGQRSDAVDSSEWYCSELVWASYHHYGVDLCLIGEFGPSFSWGTVDPDYLASDDEVEIVPLGSHTEYDPGATKPKLKVSAHCPVSLSVTDPDGLTVNLQDNGIEGAYYLYYDTDGDGDMESIIAVPERKIGNYSISVIPDEGALPGDTYSLNLTSDAGDISLATDVKVEDIPEGGYLLKSSEAELSIISEQSTWYLAEGSTDWGFDCYVSIENPNTEAVNVKLTYMTGSGPVTGPTVKMPAKSQATVFPSATLGAKDFSTKVECLEAKLISVDRTMYWTGTDAPCPEAHCATGVTAPATTWYMPEGSSAWGFECFVLIANPNDTAAEATVTWMIEGEAPQTTNVTVPASSRSTVNMADKIGAKDASIKVDSATPVICERAMYRNNRREGHDSGGTPSAASDYYLAEGCTGFGFTTYILVQNPQSTPTDVTVTYQAAAGPVTGPAFTMPANSRKTICVNDTTVIPGSDPSFSTHVHGTAPIIAERAMYWNGGDDWGQVCHDSIGLSSPHTSWYLADGQTSEGRETWTLVQNPNDADVTVEITYLTPDGTGNVVKTETIGAGSRKSFNMAEHSGISGRAAIMVRCTTAGKKVMCERAMYWNNRGTGTDTIGGYSD